MVENVLSGRLAVLREIVRNGFEDAPAQVQGFIVRVLERENRYASDGPLYQKRSAEDYLEAVRFDGYPALARAGYSLALERNQRIEAHVAERFLQCIAQQRDRPAARQAELAGDSLTLLGISEGLRVVSQGTDRNGGRLESARTWCRGLLAQHGVSDVRLGRARLLASELLDEQGRFGQQIAQSEDIRIAALDLCLWRGWPEALRNVEHPDTEQRRELFKALLSAQTPGEGELLHAASWLCAVDVLTDEIAAVAVPDAHQVAQILTETQGSFRRWRWEDKSTRKNTMAARWLIDKEADMQAFLLAVLYPYFRGQLEDEQFLRGFGLRQGRFDFAIHELGLDRRGQSDVGLWRRKWDRSGDCG